LGACHPLVAGRPVVGILDRVRGQVFIVEIGFGMVLMLQATSMDPICYRVWGASRATEFGEL